MQVIIIAHLFTLDLFCPSPLILSWWTKSAITDGTSRLSGWMLALCSTKNNNKQSACTSNFCHSVVVLGNLLCGILFMVQIFLQFKNFQTRLRFVFFGLILWSSIYDRNKSMQTGLTIFQPKKIQIAKCRSHKQN